MYGEEVLMIPEECVSMHSFQKAVLHMEENWVRTAEWPFVAVSKTSQNAVVPFEEPSQDGIMPELVLVIPLGFFTASLRLDLDHEMEEHHLGGGSFLWRLYEDAEHFKLGHLKTVGLINLITLMLKHQVPSIFTLA